VNREDLSWKMTLAVILVLPFYVAFLPVSWLFGFAAWIVDHVGRLMYRPLSPGSLVVVADLRREYFRPSRPHRWTSKYRRRRYVRALRMRRQLVKWFEPYEGLRWEPNFVYKRSSLTGGSHEVEDGIKVIVPQGIRPIGFWWDPELESDPWLLSWNHPRRYVRTLGRRRSRKLKSKAGQ